MYGILLSYFLVSTCNCWKSYKKRYAELLVLHVLSLLNPWLWNVASLTLFYWYYFGRRSSELAQLPYSWGRSTLCSDRLHDFSVTIPRCYKDVTAKLWNSLPIECFPLTYDLSGFKSRINRHLFNCRFFLNRFLVFFNLYVLLFLVTRCLAVAVQPCMKWIPIAKI